MSGKLDEYFPTLRFIPAAWRGIRWLARKTWKASLALLVLLIVAHIALNIYAGYRLEGELEKIRAAGDPLTQREAAPPKVPDAQNAAVVYEQALKHFGPFPKFDEKETPEQRTIRRFIGEFRYDEEPRSTLAEVEPILAKHAEDFRLLRQASLMTACSFPVNWDDLANLDLSHLVLMRLASQYLAAKALVDARHGRSAAALDDFATIVRMAEHVAPEPTLAAQSLRQRSLGFVRRTLPEVLTAAPPSLAQARRFSELLRQVNLIDAYVGGLKGERCRYIFIYNFFRQGGPMILYWARQPEGTKLTHSLPSRAVNALLKPVYQPFLRLDEIWMLQEMQKQIDQAAKGVGPGSGRRYASESDDSGERWLLFGLISRSVLTFASQTMVHRDEALAEFGLMQIALALRTYRAEHSEYPASLSELSTAGWSLPADPFSGQPFIYRREGKGYLVYSIGSDLADSGGLDQKAARRKNLEFSKKGKVYDPTQYDIVFRMPH